jgi:Protein of unknown function (DUF3667)
MSTADAICCRNCDAPLASEHRYCSSCGQRVAAPRLSLREIGQDLLQALANVDRRALSLVGALLVRPGGVAHDYVAGRRKRYVGPFSFLAITVALASALIALSGFRAFTSNNPNVVADFLQQHVNVVILLQAPLLAAYCALLFARDGYNYAEHLVLASFTSSMRALLLGLVAVPYWYLFRPAPSGLLTYVYVALWLLYFGYAAAQFYAGGRPTNWLKGVLAAVLTQVTTIGLVALTTYVYFRYMAPG